MCGILGIITSPNRESHLHQHDLLAMRDCMATRGLGASGLVQRKHVVLATRTVANYGKQEPDQPVFSTNDRFGLIFDGEIYQLDALRDELNRLGFPCHDESVAGVLMKAWLAWGKSFVRKLHGAFAIGIVDLFEHRCFLFRDRVGAKPLYYAQVGQDFVFASSLRAIRRHPDFSAVPNLGAIRHYLATLRLTMDDQTLFQDIHTVLPAEMLSWVAGQSKRDAYWSPDQPVLSSTSYADAVNELAELLEAATDQAVKQIRKTDRIGSVLTGGIDSSLMANLAASRSQQTLISRCGAIGSDQHLLEQPNSDLKLAERYSRERRFDHCSVVVGSDSFRQCWQQLIGEYACPLATPADVMLYQLARSLKGEAQVLLAAEGADELFCGYSIPHWAGRDYDNAMTFSRVQSTEAEQTRESLKKQYGRDRFYSPSDHFLLTSGLIPRNALAALVRPEVWPAADNERSLEYFYDQLFETQPERPMIEKYARVLFQLNTENLVSRIDRATAQAGIQVRLPYTDHRLVEFAFRLPHHFKIDLTPAERQPWLSSMELDSRKSIRSKRVLRAVAEKQIAGEIASRPKQSAPSQVPQWLAKEWKPWVRETLNGSTFFNQLFSGSAVAELQALPEQLAMWNWPMLNLALWGDQVF